ncbi:MAG: nucleoside hydrolase [Oscillospiraceae bacterium]|nr:nucleoside hydrolase [Oscillospiraceae bacterium]
MKKVILDIGMAPAGMAALCAAASGEGIEIAGVCTVGDGAACSDASRQALAVLEKLHRDISVYEGCRDSMARRLYYHPNRNSRRPEKLFPSMKGEAQNLHAVTFLIETLRAAKQKITILTAGPLTNLACALHTAPDIVQAIEEIIVVGGGVRRSDASACAESNFLADPEAAEIVLNCETKVVLLPLDIELDEEQMARMGVKDTLLEELVGMLPSQKEDLFRGYAAGMSLTLPSLLVSEPYAANVSLDHNLTAGMLVLSRSGECIKSGANIVRAVSIDARP